MAPTIAESMASELGWDADEKKKKLMDFQATAKHYVLLS
jgi:hypothetical protein